MDRPVPPMNADERTTLESWLDFYRATLAAKCDGLSDEQLRTASVPPSALTYLWQNEIDQARANCATRALDDTSPFMGTEVSLRWIYTHMIAEYARHCGHADLIRECIDGSVGV